MDTARTNIKDEIKSEPDPDLGGSVAHMDEDLYEDAGDLDLNGASQATYLARVPKYFWKYLTPESGGQDGKLGTIRVEGDLDKPQRLSLLLYRESGAKETVPLEYNLQVTQDSLLNTFVFTEQDLPGFQKKNRSFVSADQNKQSLPFSQAIPRQLNLDKSKASANRVDKNQRYQGSYRRAIPKKTAVAGKVKFEVTCLPVENEDYKKAMSIRAKQNAAPVREIQVMTPTGNYQAGNVIAAAGSHGFNEFIRPIGAQRPKGQDSKATRIPQNELLDLINGCFKRYKFWPLKALKAELQQPETYLKQTLEMVAMLVRTGPHAMTWRLKQEYQIGAYDGAADTQAPQEPPGMEAPSDLGEDGSDEDGDNVKMEDVL